MIGLDFGTSSTSVSYADLDDKKIVKTAVLESTDDGKIKYKTMPSAMFYIPELNKLLVGRQAIRAYINREYEGRLLRNLKSVLDNVEATTKISNKQIPYSRFIYNFLKRVKERVITESGTDNIVGIAVGRPVHFFDNDDERDKRAEQNLRKIIEELGFKNIVFLEEPLAASFSLESKIPTDTVAFVADIGGGTSDFAAIALGPSHIQQINRRNDVFATTGTKVGGTDFDKSFSLYRFMPELGFGTKVKTQHGSEVDFPREYFDMLSNAFSINELYNDSVKEKIKEWRLRSLARPRIGDLLHVIQTENGHLLITEIETCKKGLSYEEKYTFDRANAFDIPDNWFMTRENLEHALLNFKTGTEKLLARRDATKLLYAIKSKLEDYKKQYIEGIHEYDTLFGQTETYTVQKCKEQIDKVVNMSLEDWMKKISLISLNDIINEFSKYKDTINKTNNDKIEQNLNNFRDIREFKITFEPDYYTGYKIFDKLLEIKLPTTEIKAILENAREDIIKNIKYKEKLCSTLSAELNYNKVQELKKEAERELETEKDSRLYEEKFQQKVFEEYKRQKGYNDFNEKRKEIIEITYKTMVDSFVTNIKNSIFVECKLLNETDVLLQYIKNLTHVIELSTFNLPDLHVLEKKAIKAGTLYQGVEITREEFEYSIEQHMKKLKDSIKECIKKSGKDKSDFKYLIMTGGSSRVPKVRESIKECFDQDIKVICEDLSDQKRVRNHQVMENIDTPDDISVGLCMYAMNIFK